MKHEDGMKLWLDTQPLLVAMSVYSEPFVQIVGNETWRWNETLTRYSAIIGGDVSLFGTICADYWKCNMKMEWNFD